MATISGTGRDDLLIGRGLDDDDIRGRGGDDQIFGGFGDDKLRGNNGADYIVDGAGSDRMWGGNGPDTFKLVVDGERDFIRDWEPGDIIDVSDWGITDLADFTFQVLGIGQIQLTFGDEELQIKAKGGAALTPADFSPSDLIFAGSPAPQVIDFEDLSLYGPQLAAPINFVDASFANMEWSTAFRVVEDADALAAGFRTVAENRAGGGDMVAIGSGLEDSFSAADNFDFEEATFGAVNRGGMTLRIVVSTTGPSWASSS